jgi:hypothetical protein
MRRAEERVERLLGRVAQSDMPLIAFVPDPDREVELERVRDLAERRAMRAGRSELLDEAWDRVAGGYASRLGDLQGWVARAGVSRPGPFDYSAADRAASQIAIQDLVLAALAEDLLTPDEHATLSLAGEWMLGHGDELPDGWTPVDGWAPAGEEDAPLQAPVVAEARTWPRSELLGAGLLVTLAIIGGGVALGDALAGVGLGLGTAVLLFFWRRDPKPPEVEEG